MNSLNSITPSTDYYKVIFFLYLININKICDESLNCAPFAGMKTAGLLGAAAANLGALSPTLTLTMIAAAFFERFSKTTFMRRVMVGVRPACLGMVAAMLFSLSRTNYVLESGIHSAAVVLGVLDFILLYKYHLSIPKVIGISAAAGLCCFGLFGL